MFYVYVYGDEQFVFVAEKGTANILFTFIVLAKEHWMSKRLICLIRGLRKGI